MRSNIHPYRKLSPPDHRSTGMLGGALGEELIFYVALCLVGAIPLATPIARGGAFGVEPTIGLLMVIAGIAGLLAAWRATRGQLSG
jgi:hypothetical protein